MKYLIFIYIVFVSFAINAQETKIWDYPVKPGTEKWATFTTGQQMLDACQIPQEVLESLSTKDLAEVCLNYPLFFQYTAFNDEIVGISNMIENFNGLKELSKRKDGVKELINIYKDFPVITQIQKKTSKDYDTPYKLPFIELLLSNDIFVNQLDSQESKKLEKIILDRYECKLKNNQVYSVYNIKKTFLLGAVVISKHDMSAKSAKQLEVIRNFIKNYNNADSSLLTEISKIISEF